LISPIFFAKQKVAGTRRSAKKFTSISPKIIGLSSQNLCAIREMPFTKRRRILHMKNSRENVDEIDPWLPLQQQHHLRQTTILEVEEEKVFFRD
jgi:hypothetical protein